MNYLDVDWLKDRHKMIHYFGLGFIQLKLDEVERMHFYIPDLEPIVPWEEVHNHRYDFSSQILRGELTQQLFSVEEDVFGGYRLEDVTCNEGESPVLHPGNFSLVNRSTHTYREGSSYFISHEQFHRVIQTDDHGCITLLRRSPYAKERAQVVKSVDGLSVCPFGKKIPEDELWEHVRKALS